MKTIFGLAVPALLLAVFGVSACVHQPPRDECPLEGVESSPVALCDPDVIYFEKDVLPILRSNCAKSGCHDVVSAQDDIVLVDYATVHASLEVKPCNPADSELLKVLYENGDDRMPPAGNNALTAEQIRILEDWVGQGAQNFYCDYGCDTTDVTFSGNIWPLIETNCYGCHSGVSPQGGILITNHAELAALADSGKLMGVLNNNGYLQMPPGAPLRDCNIRAIEIWVDAGAPND